VGVDEKKHVKMSEYAPYISETRITLNTEKLSRIIGYSLVCLLLVAQAGFLNEVYAEELNKIIMLQNLRLGETALRLPVVKNDFPLERIAQYIVELPPLNDYEDEEKQTTDDEDSAAIDAVFDGEDVAVSTIEPGAKRRRLIRASEDEEEEPGDMRVDRIQAEDGQDREFDEKVLKYMKKRYRKGNKFGDLNSGLKRKI